MGSWREAAVVREFVAYRALEFDGQRVAPHLLREVATNKDSPRQVNAPIREADGCSAGFAPPAAASGFAARRIMPRQDGSRTGV